MIAIDSEL